MGQYADTTARSICRENNKASMYVKDSTHALHTGPSPTHVPTAAPTPTPPSENSCSTSSSCSTRISASGYSVYEQWEGAYSATHVDSHMTENRAVVPSGDAADSGCVTQTTIDGVRSKLTCTSCFNSSFAMIYHHHRAGACRKFTTQPDVICTARNNATSTALDWSKNPDSVCTKTLLSETDLSVDALTGAAHAHFLPVMGNNNKALARCQVRKEVS